MSLFARLSFAVLAGALVLVGCTHPPHTLQPRAADIRPEGARLSTAEVIRIASQAAERQGVDLGGYKEPKAEFDLETKSWFVYFAGRVARYGDHFSVSVDDRTGKTQLVGGM